MKTYGYDEYVFYREHPEMAQEFLENWDTESVKPEHEVKFRAANQALNDLYQARFDHIVVLH